MKLFQVSQAKDFKKADLLMVTKIPGTDEVEVKIFFNGKFRQVVQRFSLNFEDWVAIGNAMDWVQPKKEP